MQLGRAPRDATESSDIALCWLCRLNGDLSLPRPACAWAGHIGVCESASGSEAHGDQDDNRRFVPDPKENQSETHQDGSGPKSKLS